VQFNETLAIVKLAVSYCSIAWSPTNSTAFLYSDTFIWFTGNEAFVCRHSWYQCGRPCCVYFIGHAGEQAAFKTCSWRQLDERFAI